MCKCQESDLKAHLRHHCDISEFKCEYAGKNVKDQHVLEVHMKSHTTAKPFTCERWPIIF